MLVAVEPDVQEKVKSEIRETLETNGRKKLLYEIAHNIEYLDCAIKGAQHLSPQLHESTVSVTMIPDAWENPDNFDRERFQGPAKDTRRAFQFMSFGAGQRNCIGMSYFSYFI